MTTITGIPLRLELVPGASETYRLLREVACMSRVLRTWVVAPEGFETDLTSIPWFAPLRRRSREGLHTPAAVIHDYLYRVGVAGGVPVTRKQADEVFKEAMLYLGTPRWKTNLFYRAVRLGAGGTWKRYREKRCDT